MATFDDMDLLVEISRLRIECPGRTKPEGGQAGDPLEIWNCVWKEVSAAIRDACRQRNQSYAELLEESRALDSSLVDEYLALSDKVDCDVVGKWMSGCLTRDEYDHFVELVLSWKEVAMKMLQLKGFQ